MQRESYLICQDAAPDSQTTTGCQFTAEVESRCKMEHATDTSPVQRYILEAIIYGEKKTRNLYGVEVYRYPTMLH